MTALFLTGSKCGSRGNRLIIPANYKPTGGDGAIGFYLGMLQSCLIKLVTHCPSSLSFGSNGPKAVQFPPVSPPPGLVTPLLIIVITINNGCRPRTLWHRRRLKQSLFQWLTKKDSDFNYAITTEWSSCYSRSGSEEGKLEKCRSFCWRERKSIE